MKNYEKNANCSVEQPVNEANEQEQAREIPQLTLEILEQFEDCVRCSKYYSKNQREYTRKKAVEDAKRGWLVLMDEWLQIKHMNPKIGLILAKQKLFTCLCPTAQYKGINKEVASLLIEQGMFTSLCPNAQRSVMDAKLALQLAKSGSFFFLSEDVLNKYATTENVEIATKVDSCCAFYHLNVETQERVVNAEIVKNLVEGTGFRGLSSDLLAKFITPELALSLAKRHAYHWLTDDKQVEMMNEEIALTLSRFLSPLCEEAKAKRKRILRELAKAKK